MSCCVQREHHIQLIKFLMTMCRNAETWCTNISRGVSCSLRAQLRLCTTHWCRLLSSYSLTVHRACTVHVSSDEGTRQTTCAADHTKSRNVHVRRRKPQSAHERKLNFSLSEFTSAPSFSVNLFSSKYLNLHVWKHIWGLMKWVKNRNIN